MRLINLVLNKTETMISDGEFKNFGFLTSKNEGLISYLDDEKYISLLINEDVQCVITRLDLIDKFPRKMEGIIVSENPQATFWRLHDEYCQSLDRFDTRIGGGCKISKNATIADSNVSIGDNVIVEEYASIKENVVIGNNVRVCSGSVIGSEGTQVFWDHGEMIPVTHYGGVLIGDGVQVKPLVSIEKAIWGWDQTVIGSGTIVNSKVLVAHCCKIGSKCRIAGGATLLGSVRIGDDVWVGPDVTVKNQLNIGDRACIMMRSVVRRDVPQDYVVIDNKYLEKEKYEAISRFASV